MIFKFLLRASLVLVFLAVSNVEHDVCAEIITFTTKDAFKNESGSGFIAEDWTSYPPNTLLDGQQVNGITYSSTSSEQLVVGSPHGANWILGYPRDNNRYASFSREKIMFSFDQRIDNFGISLSQGNQNQGTSGAGYSKWLIDIDFGLHQYIAEAYFGQSDFTGEAYLGITGLGGANFIQVWQLETTSNISWDIREIDFVKTYTTSQPVYIDDLPPHYFSSLSVLNTVPMDTKAVTIYAQAVILPEFKFEKDKTVILKGGYNNSFTKVIGSSTFSGKLIVSKGSLIVDHLVIK